AKGSDEAISADAPGLRDAARLLEACLEEDPDHTDALWCLAAVRSTLGDRAGLAAQAPRMNRPGVADARFHFLGAVCDLAAKDFQQAAQLGQVAARDPALALESQYLLAVAHLRLRNGSAAKEALEKVAAAEKSPSAVIARAMLGHLSFARGAY